MYEFAKHFTPRRGFEVPEKFFDYDHEIGRLRWKKDDALWDALPKEMLGGRAQGQVAGGKRRGIRYAVQLAGGVRSAVPLIWRIATGHPYTRAMMINPNIEDYRTNNLCIIPLTHKRSLRNGAKGRVVVSYSYEARCYTSLDVDDNYESTITGMWQHYEDGLAQIHPELADVLEVAKKRRLDKQERIESLAAPVSFM